MTMDDGGGDGDTGTDGDDDNNSNCTEEGKSCEEIADCRLKCAQDDDACRDNCRQSGSCDAQENWDDVLNCQTNNCDDTSPPTCPENQCAAELDACGLVDMESSCATAQKCTTKCIIKGIFATPDDATDKEIREVRAACLAKCPDGTIDVQKQQSRIRGCLDTNGCFEQDSPPACGVKNCESQYEDCGVLGDKSCREIDKCTADCPRDDDEKFSSCYSNCLWTGSTQGRIDRDEYQACLRDNGCFDTASGGIGGFVVREACGARNCFSKAQTCGQVGGVNSCSGDDDCDGGRTCEDGTCQLATCPDTFSCLSNCGQDFACISACMWDSSKQATTTLGDFYSCLQQNQCQDPRGDCAKNNCPSLHNQCVDTS